MNCQSLLSRVRPPPPPPPIWGVDPPFSEVKTFFRLFLPLAGGLPELDHQTGYPISLDFHPNILGLPSVGPPPPSAIPRSNPVFRL